jgi:putative peptidoglycan lipid II flippase
MQNKINDPDYENDKYKKHVISYALSMSFGTFLSRVLGLLRDMAFAALFPRSITDAWTAAFRLPNFFRRLLGEGSLSTSFIPVFADTKIHDPTGERSRRLVFGLYGLMFIFLSIITTLGVIYSDNILQLLLDSNYVNETSRFAVTSRMAKIMFGFIFLISHFAYYMAILNALGEFFWPAFAPVFFNIAMIVSTILPQDWFSMAGDSLAWGVVCGGFLQAAVLIPQLRKKDLFLSLQQFRIFKWEFIKQSLLNPDIQNVFKKMIPGLIGTGLLQFSTLVNLYYASSLGEGPISYIYWADRLLELPLSLVSVSLGSALLPSLSRMWTVGQTKKMIETSNYYLRLNFFIAIPAAVGLWVLSKPIVEVLFKRGHFIEADLNATAGVVSIYAPLFLFTSAVRVLIPVYFAIKNTWFPGFVASISLIAHIVLAPILMKQYGLNGLVSASLFSAAFNFLLLSLFVQKIIGNYNWTRLFFNVVKMILSGALMGLVVYYTHPALTQILPLSAEGVAATVGRVFALSLTVLIGVCTYGFISWVLRVEEIKIPANKGGRQLTK